MTGTLLAQMMDRGDTNGGNGWWWVWVVGGLVVIALLVVLVIEVTRRNTRGFDSAAVHPGAPPSTMSTPPTTRPITPGAEQVLADRFARGEIDEAEFVSRRNALRT